MATAWFDDDPKTWPAGIKKRLMRIEPTPKGFWSYYDEHRSAGHLPDTPFHETLLWIVEQIALTHFAAVPDDDGEEVSLIIGKAAAYSGLSEEQAKHEARTFALALNIAGLVAEAREKGSAPSMQGLSHRIWEEGTNSAFRRMEMHYALEMARLLGRISKKLPKLQELPIVGKAPETTRALIAEATRSYLLKLDRACIALCRACLEDTLKRTLTPAMREEWFDLIDENKRLRKNPNQMHALIEVCARHGILKDLTRAAHDVREAGNTVLHANELPADSKDLAGDVLRKTRTILGLIYAEGSHEPPVPPATGGQ